MKVSDRPLWAIALMFALHLAWLAVCALWIPMTFAGPIARRLGSPLFVLPLIFFVYALAPFVASFSELGREYWDMLGRGGPARRAAVKIVLLGVLSCALAVGLRWYVRP